jgi:hypothetical protein
MDKVFADDVKEIIKILKIHKKKDLITKLQIHFEDLLDAEYEPPKSVKKERYSDSEGSAASEEEYCWETDEHGLLSLV